MGWLSSKQGTIMGRPEKLSRCVADHTLWGACRVWLSHKMVSDHRPRGKIVPLCRQLARLGRMSRMVVPRMRWD